MRICTLVVFFSILTCQYAFSCQSDSSSVNPRKPFKVTDSVKQKDLIDIIRSVFNKTTTTTATKPPGRVSIAALPTFGYTLSTGLVEGLSAVATINNKKDPGLNISVINMQVLHDAHGQNVLFIQSNLWAHNDDYKFVSDFRIEKYPDVTYGLGDTTTSKRPDPITYNYLRLYQTVLRKVVAHFYVGFG